MIRKCPNCSKRVVKGSKFCVHCGEKLPLFTKKKKKKVNKDFINVDFRSGKRLFNRYKQYLFERLYDPKISMKKSMNKESFEFGLVQLIILMLINGLIILAIHGKRGNTYNLNLSMLSLFVGALILQVLFLLSQGISLYISTNYLKNVPTTAQTITSRIGGLASVQLILAIIMYLAILIGIGSLSLLLIYLSGLLSIVNLIFYLLNIKNNSTVPNYYVIVIALGLFLSLQNLTYNLVVRFSTNPEIYPTIIRLLLS